MALCLLFGGMVAVPTAMLGREFRQDRIFLSNVVGFVPGNVVLLVLAFEGVGAMAFAWSRVVAVVFQGIAVTLRRVQRWYRSRASTRATCGRCWRSASRWPARTWSTTRSSTPTTR